METSSGPIVSGILIILSFEKRVNLFFMELCDVKNVFHVSTIKEKRIRLPKERFSHIRSRHPEVYKQKEKMKRTIARPEFVRKSRYDEKVWLFYRFYTDTPVTEKYLTVVAKILNTMGFVLTSYFTDEMKIGEEIWSR